MSDLSERLRQFADPNFMPFDSVVEEASTNRRIIPGAVRLAEVPRSAAALMGEAADALSAAHAENAALAAQLAACMEVVEAAKECTVYVEMLGEFADANEKPIACFQKLTDALSTPLSRGKAIMEVVDAARRWHAEEWSSKNLKAINAEREGWSKIDGAEAELINALRQLDGGA